MESNAIVGEEGGYGVKCFAILEACLRARFQCGWFGFGFGELDGSVRCSLFGYMTGVAFHDAIKVLDDGHSTFPSAPAVQSLDDGVVKKIVWIYKGALQVPASDEVASDHREFGKIRFLEVLDSLINCLSCGEL